MANAQFFPRSQSVVHKERAYDTLRNVLNRTLTPETAHYRVLLRKKHLTTLVDAYCLPEHIYV